MSYDGTQEEKAKERKRCHKCVAKGAADDLPAMIRPPRHRQNTKALFDGRDTPLARNIAPEKNSRRKVDEIRRVRQKQITYSRKDDERSQGTTEANPLPTLVVRETKTRRARQTTPNFGRRNQSTPSFYVENLSQVTVYCGRRNRLTPSFYVEHLRKDTR
ncbi:hypothetical protein E4U58_005002 [Claviceps cyperi]|nr:hypothetical protein E4U58_005002 [Claviceps cyperi]